MRLDESDEACRLINRILAEIGCSRMGRHPVDAHQRPQTTLVSDHNTVRGGLAHHCEIDVRARSGIMSCTFARDLLVGKKTPCSVPRQLDRAVLSSRMASIIAASGPLASHAPRPKSLPSSSRGTKGSLDHPAPAGTTS